MSHLNTMATDHTQSVERFVSMGKF